MVIASAREDSGSRWVMRHQISIWRARQISRLPISQTCQPRQQMLTWALLPSICRHVHPRKTTPSVKLMGERAARGSSKTLAT